MCGHESRIDMGEEGPALAELLVFGLQNGVEEERVTNTAVGAARLEDGIPTSTLQSALVSGGDDHKDGDKQGRLKPPCWLGVRVQSDIKIWSRLSAF